MSLHKRILLLHGRNFGDAIISVGLLEAFGRSSGTFECEVFTRPEYIPIYEQNPYVDKVYTASFPVGTSKQFGFLAAFNLVKQLIHLRKCKFDHVINLWGDIRENFLGYCISPKNNCSISWPSDSPYRSLVRQGPKQLATHIIEMPNSVINIYDTVEHVAKHLGATAKAQARLYDHKNLPILYKPQKNCIGFHVSASQECKQWPIENWRKLALKLIDSGKKIIIFGAPSERAHLEIDFAGFSVADLEILTGKLEDFFQGIAQVEALICLDSFALHAAGAIGTPRVLIIGTNMPTIWAPTNTVVVNGGDGLPCYPCSNKPTCTKSLIPYECMKRIDVMKVVEGLEHCSV